jgi:carboxymethylenebutenolidase
MLGGFHVCHDTDAAPPGLGEPPTRATGGPLTLTSADGTTFSAFLARPERPLGRTGVLILPDVRGLHPFYERLAERLAEQGHTALAIDYFGRTAGLGPRGDDFPVMEHILKVRREKIDDDIDAAADHLRSPDGGGCTSVLALGFCFGGRQAFFAARPRFGLAGVIGFYGGPGVYPNGALGPTQRANELTSPILALFGGADEGIPASEVSAFDEALGAAGVEHEIVTYPNAPHGFFDVKQAEHADASADAWRRVLGFLDRHAAG